MPLRVGINGFGRIGRLVFRAGVMNPNLEFVGVNDLFPPANLAYLLKHDSTHGKFEGTVEARDDGLMVNGKFVKAVSVKNPAELPWRELKVDYVVESTGLFLTKDTAQKHLTAGAKKVILSAYPRLDMKNMLTTCLRAIATDHPNTTRDNFIADFGMKYVPGYTRVSSVDLLHQAPFAE